MFSPGNKPRAGNPAARAGPVTIAPADIEITISRGPYYWDLSYRGYKEFFYRSPYYRAGPGWAGPGRAGTRPGSRQPVTLAPAGYLSPGQKAGQVAGSR